MRYVSASRKLLAGGSNFGGADLPVKSAVAVPNGYAEAGRSDTAPNKDAKLSLAMRERQALVELLDTLGPDAVTYCDGWCTRDLAAHLYVRENRPRALLGLDGRRFKDIAEREMAAVLVEFGYQEILRRLGDGPRGLWRLVDPAVNAIEYFVHHEDVRRAQLEPPAEIQSEIPAADQVRARVGGWEAEQGVTATVTGTGTGMERALSLADRGDLARRLGLLALLLPKPGPIPCYLQASDLPNRPTWRLGSGRSPLGLQVVGPIGELVLWAFGRRDVAIVEAKIRCLR